MEFFSFIVLVLIAVILWRINNQIPDLIFRLSEIQRDIAFFKKSKAASLDLDQDDASSK